jgi:hypothetical protein
VVDFAATFEALKSARHSAPCPQAFVLPGKESGVARTGSARAAMHNVVTLSLSGVRRW